MCISALMLVITKGVMWHNMGPYNWLNKFYSFCMVIIMCIVSRSGIRIEAYLETNLTRVRLQCISCDFI